MLGGLLRIKSGTAVVGNPSIAAPYILKANKSVEKVYKIL